MDLPLPMQPWEGGIIIASVWVRDIVPPFTCSVIVLRPSHPYYYVCEFVWSETGKSWYLNTRSPFMNIVEATDYYQQMGGDI